MRANGNDRTLMNLSYVMLWRSCAWIPHDDTMIFRTSDNNLATQAPAPTRHACRVACENLHHFAAGGPPHPCHRVVRPCEDGMALRMPKDPLYLLRWSLQVLHQGSISGVPNPHRAIIGTCSRVGSVRAEGHLHNGVCVSLQETPLATPEGAILLFYRPENGRIILSTRKQNTPVCRADGHRQHAVLVDHFRQCIVSCNAGLLIGVNLALRDDTNLLISHVIAAVVIRRFIILELHLQTIPSLELRVKLLPLGAAIPSDNFHGLIPTSLLLGHGLQSLIRSAV
mmetsp:Transcript_4825/g.10518  ORF Transcript_4825/g.10518 Transcript_4825/m.10518 type:complete len:283 (-) Transcript_4825:32-880(-)